MRRVLVAVALVLGALAAPASASEAACPPEVLAATGTNPSPAEISALLEDAAVAHGVPVAVLKAVAYRETVWRQFDEQGKPVISQADQVCGVGIMQVTADGRDDAELLATSIDHNVDVGAAILAEKWALSASTPVPDGYEPDDPHVLENWYYSLCLYNGCNPADDTVYAAPVAQLVADPFRRVTDETIRPYMPPAGFTNPSDAWSSYDFPDAFQAQYAPEQRFVFYDSQTRQVTNDVPARTHDDRHPPVVSYGPATYGPDGPGVTCWVCGGWRLAEGVGVTGRAHWTNSVTGSADQTQVTWTPALPRTGRYRILAYVPPIGADALGAATYRVGGSPVYVDQDAVKGSWTSLGDWTLAPGVAVELGDLGDEAGRKLVADAVRFVALTKLDLAVSAGTVTYPGTVTLTARLTQVGSTGLAGRAVKLYRRPRGTASWTYLGTWATKSDGRIAVTTRPLANTEYTARFTPAVPGEAAAASPNRTVYVRPLLTATLDRTTMPAGGTARVSVRSAPNHAGRRVQLQRYYGGAWHGVASTTLSSSSTASFAVRYTTPGTYYLRVVQPADADHATATTAKLTLRVTT